MTLDAAERVSRSLDEVCPYGRLQECCGCGAVCSGFLMETRVLGACTAEVEFVNAEWCACLDKSECLEIAPRQALP